MLRLVTFSTAVAVLAIVSAGATAQTITYEANDPGGDWTLPAFVGTKPVSGDLAESATVTLEQGAGHASHGVISRLNDGTGGSSGHVSASYLTKIAPPNEDKILMSWDGSQNIAKVSTFSWQNFDVNDNRFPQIYRLYGSSLASPAFDDGTLDAGVDWTLLATVDSPAFFLANGPAAYHYSGFEGAQNPAPEQLAVTVAGDGGPLGSYQHLLFRIAVHPDPDGPPAGGGTAHPGSSAFWSEIDVIPEPSSLVLVVVGALVMSGWFSRRRSSM